MWYYKVSSSNYVTELPTLIKFTLANKVLANIVICK
jgi:hypothetical protein